MALRCLIVCTFLAASCSSILAADGASDKVIADLLETCWDTSADAKALADQKFAAFLKVRGGHPQDYYAHALLMMYQRRFSDCLASLDQVLKLDEDNLAALRAKVWVAVLTKNYGVALPAMEQLARSAAEFVGDPEHLESAEDAARFLGVVYGFLDGPLGDTAALASRGETERRIIASLDEKRRTIFTEARQSVIEKYTALINERQDSREAKIAEDDAEREKTLADIDDRRADMNREADELKERREKLGDELQAELDEIGKLDRPLASQHAQLLASAGPIRSNLAAVLLDIDRLDLDLSQTDDPIVRVAIIREIDRLVVLSRSYDAELGSLSRSIDIVVSKRAELASRQVKAQNNLGGQITAIDRQFFGMAAEEKKLANAERKALKPSRGSSGKVAGLAVAATALKTYEPFPIEQERERLLLELE